MEVLISVWGLLRVLVALAAFGLVVLTVTTLFGWFTVSSDGEQVAWYLLLGAALLLGAVGITVDNWFERRTTPDPEKWAAFQERMSRLESEEE